MSVRGPALVVLGIAVFIVVVGIVASALASGSDADAVHPDRITIPDGTVVHLTPATTAMKSIVSAGQPPADILGNLAVPVREPGRPARSTPTRAPPSSTAPSSSPPGSPPTRWSTSTARSCPGWAGRSSTTEPGAQRSGRGTEVLAKQGSGDGFYWEVGVVVSPTTSAGTTPFSVELFELPDDN